MIKEITQLTGTKPGNTSIVLVGVHGDEKCGVEALEKVLQTLEIKKGNVWFIVGNPRAIEVNKRYTETNLNRMFNPKLPEKAKLSYEYQRAQFLKTYLDQADVLLDIHASSVPNSKTFIICELNSKEITKYLPTETVVTGFDTVEPGGTDYYMNTTGKIGICFECGYINDSKSTEVAEQAILAFLKAREHIEGTGTTLKQNYINMYFKYFTKTDNFTLSKSFENFEIVEKNQLIGMDGTEKVLAPKQSLILFAHNGKNIGEEAFLLGEQKESLV